MRSEHLNSDASATLFQAWRRGPNQGDGDRLARTLSVPGTVGLRGRFLFLIDPQVPDLSIEQFDISWEEWTEQIELTEKADSALVNHDFAMASVALTELQSSTRSDRHPLAEVDALVGLGDLARQSDDFDNAAVLLDEAVKLAERSHYRFGIVRARVSAGYLMMQAGSLGEASEMFESAASICRELDERVYLANALTGLGETKARLRQDESAITALEGALEVFESVRSHGGIVNASQHLGDLFRRRRDLEAASRHFTRALEIASENGPWIGVVNAGDGLAEVELGRDDASAAIEQYTSTFHLARSKNYSRGQAHALNGLGRCALHEGDPALAREMHGLALALYRELGDLSSSANALDGMARAATTAGDLEAASQDRLAAVTAIESMRAAQDDHIYQQEYRIRFASVYSSALRAAIAAQDSNAFVAVFEGLAGRRLAGLVESIPEGSAVADVQLDANLTARAYDSPDELTTDTTDARRRARLIGRLALRHSLPDLVEKSLADIAAALYRPFDPTLAGELLDRCRNRSTMLLLAQDPARSHEVSWLVTTPATPMVAMGTAQLDEPGQRVLDDLAANGLPANATRSHLSSLGKLLSGIMSDAQLIASEDSLLIVPLGSLWAVPWNAIEIGNDRFLGESRPVAVAPSMTLADSVGQADWHRPTTAAQWRSSDVLHHRHVALKDHHHVTVERLDNQFDALEAITTARHDLVDITGHGHPVPGIGHYLKLGPDAILEPTALLTARTPPQLVLAACWGAHAPGMQSADPMTLATLALTRGSSSVAATTSEMADDPLATSFVDSVLYRLADMPMEQALFHAIRRYLKRPGSRDEILSRWAPLMTVGAIRGSHANGGQQA